MNVCGSVFAYLAALSSSCVLGQLDRGSVLRVSHLFASALNPSYVSTYLATIDFEKFCAMSDVVCVVAPISWWSPSGLFTGSTPTMSLC